MVRKLTCIVCPLGCEMEISVDVKANIEYIKGNTCKRGAEYATNECINPVRMLTTTVKAENGTVIPVKTNKAIPKNKLFDCMKIINNKKVVLPILSGDVIIENILGLGADIIATDSKF